LIKEFCSSLALKMKGSRNVVEEIMYGFLLHEPVLVMRKERGHLDDLFMLVIFGDLVGLPLHLFNRLDYVPWAPFARYWVCFRVR